MKENDCVVSGDGNIFEVLGLPDADALNAKAQLANQIHKAMSSLGLTQSEAAALMGTTQAKVGDIVRCKLDGYTIDRLFRFLNALGQDIEITVTPKPKGRDARVRVAS